MLAYSRETFVASYCFSFFSSRTSVFLTCFFMQLIVTDFCVYLRAILDKTFNYEDRTPKLSFFLLSRINSLCFKAMITPELT